MLQLTGTALQSIASSYSQHDRCPGDYGAAQSVSWCCPPAIGKATVDGCAGDQLLKRLEAVRAHFIDYTGPSYFPPSAFPRSMSQLDILDGRTQYIRQASTLRLVEQLAWEHRSHQPERPVASTVPHEVSRV